MEFRVDQTWEDPMNEESKDSFEIRALWNVQKDVTVAREGTGTRDES